MLFVESSPDRADFFDSRCSPVPAVFSMVNAVECMALKESHLETVLVNGVSADSGVSVSS